jgi:TIR domain
MSDIFISYAREDTANISSLVSALQANGWTVYWDQRMRGGAQFARELEKEIEAAKVVIVCWSPHTRSSDWVPEEAALAKRLNKLVPILLDGDLKNIALGYLTLSTVMLTTWPNPEKDPNFPQLVSQLGQAIGLREALAPIGVPKKNFPITESHLALIHSSWRTPEWEAKFKDGRKYYRIHVIVFGEPAALDRIEKVTYHLPAAYPKHEYESTDRSHHFELKELANGYSVIHADVKIKDQADLVHLSRFVNLTETGPRLDSMFSA